MRTLVAPDVVPEVPATPVFSGDAEPDVSVAFGGGGGGADAFDPTTGVHAFTAVDEALFEAPV